MINSSEMIFVVDEFNNPVKPQLRSFVHENRLWHRTTGIWVINHKKQILCQKRSLRKDTKPGFWEAFFGGHLGPYEDFQQNAANEVGEELGINIDKNDLISYKVLKSDKPNHKEFQHVFALIIKNENIDFNFEKEEIDEISWIGLEAVRKILIEDKDERWVKKPWDKEVLDWLEKLRI